MQSYIGSLKINIHNKDGNYVPNTEHEENE